MQNGDERDTRDELVADEVAEADADGETGQVATSHNLFCWAPVHRQRWEVVMFSRPLTLSWGQFIQEAEAAGWRYDADAGGWRCADCVAATATTLQPQGFPATGSRK